MNTYKTFTIRIYSSIKNNAFVFLGIVAVTLAIGFYTLSVTPTYSQSIAWIKIPSSRSLKALTKPETIFDSDASPMVDPSEITQMLLQQFDRSKNSDAFVDSATPSQSTPLMIRVLVLGKNPETTSGLHEKLAAFLNNEYKQKFARVLEYQNTILSDIELEVASLEHQQTQSDKLLYLDRNPTFLAILGLQKHLLTAEHRIKKRQLLQARLVTAEIKGLAFSSTGGGPTKQTPSTQESGLSLLITLFIGIILGVVSCITLDERQAQTTPKT